MKKLLFLALLTVSGASAANEIWFRSLSNVDLSNLEVNNVPVENENDVMAWLRGACTFTDLDSFNEFTPYTYTDLKSHPAGIWAECTGSASSLGYTLAYAFKQIDSKNDTLITFDYMGNQGLTTTHFDNTGDLGNISITVAGLIPQTEADAVFHDVTHMYQAKIESTQVSSLNLPKAISVAFFNVEWSSVSSISAPNASASPHVTGGAYISANFNTSIPVSNINVGTVPIYNYSHRSGNLNSLSGIESFNFMTNATVDIRTNDVTDISPMNAHDIGVIRLDVSDIVTKADAGQAFCQKINAGNLSVYDGSTLLSSGVAHNALCQ